CDNCLLVLPLRGGAMAWAIIIALYSIAGGIFLLIRGQFLFFEADEWYVYGGVGLAVAFVAVIDIFALSNRSYIWTRVCKFLWPFIIVISAVRAILMIVELNRGQDHIIWECQNGGQLYSSNATTISTTSDDSTTFPAGFCAAGFSSIYVVFIVSLLVDLVFQIYMYFMTWRYQKRLEHYSSMKGPYAGGKPLLHPLFNDPPYLMMCQKAITTRKRPFVQSCRFCPVTTLDIIYGLSCAFMNFTTN
ncbi:hypothetical protein F5877DRAFT_34649, partial [Lentinula edodes]